MIGLDAVHVLAKDALKSATGVLMTKVILMRRHVTLAVTMFAVSFGCLADIHAAESRANQWSCNPLGWTLGDNVFRSSGHNSGFAVLDSAAVCERVSVEADVEVARPIGNEWKIAGVAIFTNPENFWHFALIMPPKPEQGQPSCELGEMYNGVWLSQSNLKLMVRESKSEPWQPGKSYRLRIAMDSESVEGTLTDSRGQVIERIRYALSNKAVRTGRPAIRSEGFDVAFANIVTACSSPTPPKPPTQPAYHSDSFVKDIQGKKTGFFHVEKQGDTWWAIDPLGRGFTPLGVDHASYRVHGCEKLGYAPYERKNKAKYKNTAQWADETFGRLRAWGFNLLGANCDAELTHRGMAHTAFLAFGQMMSDGDGDASIIPNGGVPGSAFPNVFHPGFERFCRYSARRACESHRGDPWLFGYFLDNELAWWGTSDIHAGLFDSVMKNPAGHSAKRALRDFLAKRYDNDIARFNKAWGTQVESFDAILQRDSLVGTQTETVLADKEAFVGLIGERYFATICLAIREVDPDHMILGCRFAGGYCSSGVWAAAGRHCDIVTFNYYGNVDLDRGIARDDTDARFGKPITKFFQKYYDDCQRPMMVTEWSFPAIDAGLPSIHGAGQRFRTQAERAKATEITARTMLAMPFMLGYDYFMWVDEPALGISAKFPEDSNYGLVNEDGKPYDLLTTAFTRVHKDASRLHQSKQGLGDAESTEATPTSSLTKFLEAAVQPSAAGASQHPALRFERGNDKFTISNGPWEIRGRIGAGGLTHEVRHRGLAMGRFNGMVQQLGEQNDWIDVEKLSDVRMQVGPKGLVVDLTGRYDAPPQSLRRSFEIAYRLVLPPETDWFVAQMVSCRNTDTKPMQLRDIYFRLYSQIGGHSDDAPASLDVAPRLWGDVNGDAWLSKTARAFWGLTGDDANPLKMSIRFWLDEGKQQHSDARLELKQQLASGETYRPPLPMAVVCVAGHGDRLEWERQARKTLQELRAR